MTRIVGNDRVGKEKKVMNLNSKDFNDLRPLFPAISTFAR